MKAYDHLKSVPELPDKINVKKTRPRQIAWVDEDNCTGCQACVPFCPVDCIEPVPIDKHTFPPIPPVHVRDNECIDLQNKYTLGRLRTGGPYDKQHEY